MILVFGRTGQVATALARDADVIALGREMADLTDPAACAAIIRERRPQAVINAAAYTAVDKAESEEAIAHVINAEAPGAMAQAAAELGVPFVHISTDYVFDGSGSGAAPWRPDDATGPLGAYGRTKLAGEDAVRAAGGVHVILRTAWVFSATGANFVKTMLRLGATRDELGIVADQIGGPTPADAIADACLTIARKLMTAPDLSGTYHFSGAPDTSWAGFARTIFEAADLSVRVNEIATSDYPTPAARPANSRLDCSATDAAFGIPRPDWRAALRAVIQELEGERT
ncbi:dTDP-4-dehydrorhamnose reductase [Rhodobacterales bacterium HKCCE3408]|nr:dTDP-4-dehydrorhamnose reductase [Rhodobacterales bacterium HKCCE3408]